MHMLEFTHSIEQNVAQKVNLMMNFDRCIWKLLRASRF